MRTGLQRFGSEESVAGAYPGTRTQDVRADAEGGVWFSLFDGGVARLPPHWRNFAAFRHVPSDPASLQRSRVNALGVEGTSAIWVSSGNGGLDRIDRSSGQVERWGERLQLPGQALLAVLPDGDGHVWVGTQRGLRRYSLATQEMVELPTDLTRADALPQGFVNQLARAPDGNLWASVRGGGIARVATDPPRVLRRYLPATKDLGDADIVALALDASATPWIATASGVERYAAQSDRFDAVAGLPQEPMHALAFAPDGALWLHRLGALERYRISGAAAHLEQRFDAASGWPTLTAGALAVSADGSVWVTSLRGLWRVDGRSHAIRRFDARDGLPSPEFLSGALAAGAGRNAVRGHARRRGCVRPGHDAVRHRAAAAAADRTQRAPWQSHRGARQPCAGRAAPRRRRLARRGARAVVRQSRLQPLPVPTGRIRSPLDRCRARRTGVFAAAARRLSPARARGQRRGRVERTGAAAGGDGGAAAVGDAAGVCGVRIGHAAGRDGDPGRLSPAPAPPPRRLRSPKNAAAAPTSWSRRSRPSSPRWVTRSARR